MKKILFLVVLLILSGCASKVSNTVSFDGIKGNEQEEIAPVGLEYGVIPYLETHTIAFSCDYEGGQSEPYTRLYVLNFSRVDENDELAKELVDAYEGKIDIKNVFEGRGIITNGLTNLDVKEYKTSNYPTLFVIEEDKDNKTLDIYMIIKPANGFSNEHADGGLFEIDYSAGENHFWPLTKYYGSTYGKTRGKKETTGYANFVDKDNPYIGKLVQINEAGNGVRIRSSAEVNNENKVGKVNTNWTYLVYDEVKDDKYTWYKVTEERWVANNGSWLKESEIPNLKDFVR